jgi:hypothetical protein
VNDDYIQEPDKIDPDISAHVASTDVNAYLPPSFIPSLVKNKPAWWVSRFVYSSFTYAEGLVYPSAMKHVIPTYPIPAEWKRIWAFDYGLADDAVFLGGAIDETAGDVVIYKETRTKNMDVHQLAELFKDSTKDIPIGGWLCAPLIDPKSSSKRDYNKDSLADLFVEEGIAFEPGYINLDARVMRLNTYLESGHVKIMDCCTGLIRELKEYKFPPRSLSREVAWDKPEDKNNHAINPLEWICMKLPANPKNIVYGAYAMDGSRLLGIEPEKQQTPWQLRDNDTGFGQLAFSINDFTRGF